MNTGTIIHSGCFKPDITIEHIDFGGFISTKVTVFVADGEVSFDVFSGEEPNIRLLPSRKAQ